MEGLTNILVIYAITQLVVIFYVARDASNLTHNPVGWIFLILLLGVLGLILNLVGRPKKEV